MSDLGPPDCKWLQEVLKKMNVLVAPQCGLCTWQYMSSFSAITKGTVIECTAYSSLVMATVQSDGISSGQIPQPGAAV